MCWLLLRYTKRHAPIRCNIRWSYDSPAKIYTRNMDNLYTDSNVGYRIPYEKKSTPCSNLSCIIPLLSCNYPVIVPPATKKNYRDMLCLQVQAEEQRNHIREMQEIHLDGIKPPLNQIKPSLSVSSRQIQHDQYCLHSRSLPF